MNYTALTNLGYQVKTFKIGVNIKEQLSIVQKICLKNSSLIFINHDISFIQFISKQSLPGLDFIFFNKDNYYFGNYSRDFTSQRLRKYLESDFTCRICFEVLRDDGTDNNHLISCSICTNTVCFKCSPHLDKCPYCRGL